MPKSTMSCCAIEQETHTNFCIENLERNAFSTFHMWLNRVCIFLHLFEIMTRTLSKQSSHWPWMSRAIFNTLANLFVHEFLNSFEMLLRKKEVIAHSFEQKVCKIKELHRKFFKHEEKRLAKKPHAVKSAPERLCAAWVGHKLAKHTWAL